MTLESTFYSIGIVFMIIMLLLLVALVAAVFVIRTKIVEMHQKIEEKFQAVSNIASVGKGLVQGAKSVIKRRPS